MFPLRFDFPGEGLTPLQGAPVRYWGAWADWLRTVTTNYVSVGVAGDAQHKLYFRTVTTAFTKMV